MSPLIALIIVPLIASFLYFIGSFCCPLKKGIHALAFILSLMPLFILLLCKSELMETIVLYPLFQPLDIQFYLKVDELSYLFLLITALIIPFAILAVKGNERPLFGGILFLQFLLFVFFTVRDLALFAFFWEAALLPLYFIIALYGGRKREKAATQFIIYQIAGSCLLVAGVISLYLTEKTFNLDTLEKINMPFKNWVFAVFVLAFAVKTPLFPFHGWLKNSYRESSTAGTILLAALLSKLGVYGFFRIGEGVFPTLLETWSPYLLPLAIIGALYGAFAAYMEKDYKTLFAYSSLSHVNFILVGIFLYSQTAHLGALLQVFNHAVTITALFLIAAYLQERIGTYELRNSRGLAKSLPTLYRFSFLVILAGLALPSTNNFVGEFLIFLGVFQYSGIYVTLLGTTTILSCLYLLRYVQLNFSGREEEFDFSLRDIGKKEIFILLPLLILIFLIGIYPNILIKQLETIR